MQINNCYCSRWESFWSRAYEHEESLHSDLEEIPVLKSRPGSRKYSEAEREDCVEEDTSMDFNL